MRLTKHSDFALRVLIYLASFSERLVSTEEISEAFGISNHHLVKVVNKLGKHGLLELKRGRGGGIRLAVDPAEIRLGALVQHTEPDFYLVECFDAETNQCPLTAACALVGPLEEAQAAFIAALDRYTLADVIRGRRKDRYRELLQIRPHG